jgi:hypothetical protein
LALLKRKATDDGQTDASMGKRKSSGRSAQLSRLDQRRRVVGNGNGASGEASEQPVANLNAPAVPDSASSNALVSTIQALASFPIGEVAYGAEIPDMPLLELEIFNHGVIRYPYGFFDPASASSQFFIAR